jgi:chemotaxis protein MotD
MIAAVRNDASQDGGGFASQLSSLALETADKQVADEAPSSQSDTPALPKPATTFSALLAAFNDGSAPHLAPSSSAGGTGGLTHSSFSKTGLQTTLQTLTQQSDSKATSAFGETAGPKTISVNDGANSSFAKTNLAQTSLKTLTQQSDSKAPGILGATADPAVSVDPKTSSVDPKPTSIGLKTTSADSKTLSVKDGSDPKLAPSSISGATDRVLNNGSLAASGLPKTPPVLPQQSDPQTASVASETAPPTPPSVSNKATPSQSPMSYEDATSTIASMLSAPKGNEGHGQTSVDKTASATSSAKASRPSIRPSADKTSAAVDLTGSAQAAIAVLSTAFSPLAATTGGLSGMGSQPPVSPPGGRVSAGVGQVNTMASHKATSASNALPASSSAAVAALNNDSFDLADTAEDDSQTVKMNVSSIQSETHLIPAQAPAPAQQIADFIAANAAAGGAGTNAGAVPAGNNSDASSTGAAASAFGTGSALQSATPISSPVKILTLTLEPDTLGAVTVTMRLVDSGLSLQVAAAKSDTASLIERDKDKISDRLRSLGYAIDNVEVKTAAVQNSNSTSTNDQSATSQGQQSASDAGASSQSQNGSSGSSNDRSSTEARNDSGNSLNQDEPGESAARRTVGGLYL